MRSSSAEASRSRRPCTNAASNNMEFWTLVTASAREYSDGKHAARFFGGERFVWDSQQQRPIPFRNHGGDLGVAVARHSARPPIRPSSTLRHCLDDAPAGMLRRRSGYPSSAICQSVPPAQFRRGARTPKSHNLCRWESGSRCRGRAAAPACPPPAALHDRSSG